MEDKVVAGLLEAHSLQRHDFLNELQIIKGYLQLGKPEKAQEYIVKAVKPLQECSRLAKLKLPYLQGFLLSSYIIVNAEKVDLLSFSLEDNLDSWQAYDKEITGLLLELLDYLKINFINNIIKCCIKIKKDQDENKVELHIKGNVKEIIFIIEELVNKINMQEGNFFLLFKEQAQEECSICIGLKK